MKNTAGPNPLPENQPGRRQIRSFVLRAGRITKAQQRALKELWPIYGVAADGRPLSLPVVFGRNRPTYVEIGFGNGDALIHMARQHSSANYLGIEVHRPGIGSALIKAHEAGLENVRVLCTDAVAAFRDQIPAATLAGVRVYFPDPWPKKRHHKRRIVNADFVQLVYRALRPGGVLHLATDWLPYAEWMIAVLRTHGRFVDLSAGERPTQRPDFRPQTKFERRGERLGHQVTDLLFQKPEDPGRTATAASAHADPSA